MPTVLEPSQIIGRAYASARSLAGMDQGQLATAAKISPSTVSNVERGNDAREDTLKAIRRAFRDNGVSLSIDKTNGLIQTALVFEEAEDDEL